MCSRTQSEVADMQFGPDEMERDEDDEDGDGDVCSSLFSLPPCGT